MRRIWPDLITPVALLLGLWHAGALWPVALVALLAWGGLLLVRQGVAGGRQPFTAWMQVLVAACFLTLRFVVPRLPGRGPGGLTFAVGLFIAAVAALMQSVRHQPWGRVDPGRDTVALERRTALVLARWLACTGTGVALGGLLLSGRWPLAVLGLATAILTVAGWSMAATSGARRPPQRPPTP